MVAAPDCPLCGKTSSEALLCAGKKGAKRVNYCFITFENWRSAQRACNQSERNIHGKVSLTASRATLYGPLQN